MTREEREEAIKNIKEHCYFANLNPQAKKSLDVAIEALEQEPCEDVVKREAVLNTLDTMDKALDEDRTVEHYKELLAECYKMLPPVNPTRPMGEWKQIVDKI